MPEKEFFVVKDGKSRSYTEAEYNSPEMQEWLGNTAGLETYEFSKYNPEDETLRGDSFQVYNPAGKSRNYTQEEFESPEMQEWVKQNPDFRIARVRPTGAWGDNIRKQMSHEALVAKATGADQEWRDAGKAQEQAAKIKSELDAARQQLEDFDKKSSSELAAIPGQQQRVMKQGEQAKSRGELQKQIRDLEEKYYNSNAVLQQRQYGKDAASIGNEEAKKEYEQIQEEKKRNGTLANSFGGPSIAAGGAPAFYGEDYETRLYNATRRLNDDAYRLHDAPSKYGDEKGFDNFMKGAKDRASTADFWSMGLTGLQDSMQLTGVFDKIREKLGKMTEVTEENIDETLDPLEKQLLYAFFRNADAKASRAEDMSRGYQAGQSAMDSAMFMAEFALSGSITKALAKGVSKIPNKSVQAVANWARKALAKEAPASFSKGAATLGRDFGNAIVSMWFQPGTYKGILDAQNQLDENGEFVNQSKAAWNAILDRGIEVLSESTGGYIPSALGYTGKKAAEFVVGKDVLSKIANNPYAKWGQAFLNSDQLKMLKAGGWHGFFGEMTEEFIGDALRSVTGVNPDAWKEAWDRDNIAVMALSFLPMSIFGGAVNTAKYGYTRKQYGDNRADFGERLAGLKFSDEQIAHALDLGRYESPESIRETMQPLGIEMLKRGATKQDMESAVKYMESAAKMNAYDGYEGEKVRQDREAALGELTETYGDFWQGDNKTGRIVERVTLPDGKSGFVQDTDETGIMTVKWDDGSVSFTDAEHGAETETSSLDQYLDSMILMTKGAQEAASMQEEEMQSRQAMAEKIAANEAVPMGTEEAPVDGTYIGRDQQGMNIIETPDGQVTLSDDDLAAKWGINLHPQTQAQKDADAVAEYDAAISRRNAYNTIPRGTEIEAHLEGLDQPVKYNFTHALFDEEDQEVKIYVEDQQTGEEIPLPESAFPDLAKAAAQYSQRREDVSADVEAQREAAVMGEEAPAETPRDFRGNQLPLKEDGSVNQTELWNKDPEAWAAWNDDQRRDGGVNSRNYVQAAANTVQAEIDAARKQYDSELDFDKREAIEKQIAEKTKRLDGLNRVLEGYNAREEAAKRAEEEAARKTPEQAAAEAAEEAARVEAERQKPLEERAKAWEERTGQKVTVIHNFDEIPNSEVTARASIRLGLNVNGWYSTSQGHVMLYLPNIPNEAEVDKTYMHEVVSHKGLREMLGEERFNELMDHTWNDIMSEADRKRFTDYVKLTWPDAKDEALRRSAADEYIADLAENIDTNPTAWAKFVAKVKEILEKILGTELKITDDDLKTLLQASLARYEEMAKTGSRNEEVKSEIEMNVGGAVEVSGESGAPTQFSIKSIATGSGLSIIPDNGHGDVAFQTPDGKVYDSQHHISAEDLKNIPNSVMSYMMADARRVGTVDAEHEDVIWNSYASMLNMMLDRGVASNGISGQERLASTWEWEVENTVYKSVSTNSDSQYSYSLDITRVCKKNEAVIKAISAMQKKVGYGITPGQIMDIYMSGVEEGYQVPCPVCYVFSRYINNGKYATIAINGQHKYGDQLVDPSTLSEAGKARKIAYWLEELEKQEALNEKNAKEIAQAKKDVASIIAEINKISEQITSGKLEGDALSEALVRAQVLDEEYRAAFDVVSQSSLTQWIKSFAIYNEKGEWRLYDDTFQGFPPEYALDLRLTAETIQKYPGIQRLRKSGGSAAGKEIHFASNNDLGDVPMMVGADLKKAQNYYQLAAKASDEVERAKFLKKASDRFDGAHRYAQQQSLRGGQRMWSWSDNIERLAPDVYVNLMQMQLLGGAVQSYSKQLEGVNLAATMGAYVNGSLMGYGKGYAELGEEEVRVENGVEVLAHDITDTVTETTENGQRERTRILAKEGSPVFSANGRRATLLFDDVVGIDPYGRDQDGKHLKGLFDLNGELDKAGNIIVGMNDSHIRLAMADNRIFFIIPWHASGNSVHIVQQMLSYLGVETDIKDYTDYTDVQEEKDVLGSKKINPKLIEFWEAHKNEEDFRVGIKGGIPSGNGKGGASRQQIHYRELRDAIFLGVQVDTGKKNKDGKPVYKSVPVAEAKPAWLKEILADEFLSQVYDKVMNRVDAQQMTNGDTGAFYSYEYWDENSTIDTADVNGARYLEYCRRLGYKPVFVGTLGEKKADHGNFADDKGYWKLLIDRRMYDVNGRFQGLTPTTTDNFSPEIVDPEWTGQNFQVTRVADDPGADRIAQIAIDREQANMPGGVPTIDYSSDLEGAVQRYKALLDDRKARTAEAKKRAKQAKNSAKTGDQILGEILESIDRKNAENQAPTGEKRGSSNRESVQQIRFRVSNADQRIFVSNAEKAVEEMKMDKATPEQWKKTLEKNGGLKAAEDKWLGLSTWLDGLDRKTVTKQEILDFIAENQIKIEEQRYTEDAEKSYADAIAAYQQEYAGLVAEGEQKGEKNPYVYAYGEMGERYGDDFDIAFDRDGDTITPTMDYYGEQFSDAAEHFLDQRREETDVRGINQTRLGYTTEGLTNRQEIALTVPTIEPWNESDKIHFGDAGEGRAISWARFGDTWTSKAKDEAEKRYREADKAYRDYRNEIVAKYALQATDSKKTIDLATEEETAKVKALRDEANRLYHEWQYGQHPREKVLVIDEIQSKRHQEAREKGGYKDDTVLNKAKERMEDAYDAFYGNVNRLNEKYGEGNVRDMMTPDEEQESQRLYREYRDATNAVARNGFDPMADEEYRRLLEEQRAHENSPEFKGLMEDWKNAEGFDARQAINEKLKPFQERNRELLDAMEERERILADEFNATHKSQIPAAPFEKNWPELTMKRMLRYAAENGYDTVAWTTGDQQAERYNLGGVLNDMEVVKYTDGGWRLVFEFKDGHSDDAFFDKDGIVVGGGQFQGKHMSEIVGKELADRIMSKEAPRKGTFSDPSTADLYDIKGDGLRIGGEGMKGFYDEILPRFMNKYGKKWGVKVEDVYLPALGEDAAAGAQKGLTMHSVPVTEEMKESVMQGQTMFRVAMEERDKESKELFDAAKERFGTTKDLREAGYVLPDGTMLDFSGRHMASGDTSYLNGSRTVDHRDIEDLNFERDLNTPSGRKTSMPDFISRGAIRIHMPGMINLAVKPTAQQESVLERLINADNSYVSVDFGDGNRTEHSAEYEGARPARIVNDIRRYFDEGYRPGGNTMFRIEDAINKVESLPNDEKTLSNEEADRIHVVNDEFNNELASTTEDNVKDKKYSLGKPGSILRDAGVSDKEMILYGSKLQAKAKLHGFNYEDIKDLPELVNDPIAVFNNYNKDNNRSILTEIEIGDNNMLVAVNVGKKNDVDFNIIASIFDKSGDGVVNWLEKDYETYVNKEKALDYLLRHAPIAASTNNSELSSTDKDSEKSETTNDSEEKVSDEGQTVFRVVTDPLKIAELEAKPKVKVFRSMQEIDGKLYPPMSARVDGEMRQPTELGVWEESEENPALADENGNFKLDKGNGKSLKAAYAPYFHTRRSPLNEQFSEAYNRPNLVIVEGEIPESELTSGYTAEKSKKPVGEHDWPSGKVSNALAKGGQDTRKVLLSRWFKPIRVVPNSEVADMIMERVGDSDIAFPYNVVTPGLREELAKRGARFDGWQGNKPADVDEQIARMQSENEQTPGNTLFRVGDRNPGESTFDYMTRLHDAYEQKANEVVPIVIMESSHPDAKSLMDLFNIKDDVVAEEFAYALEKMFSGVFVGAYSPFVKKIIIFGSTSQAFTEPQYDRLCIHESIHGIDHKNGWDYASTAGKELLDKKDNDAYLKAIYDKLLPYYPGTSWTREMLAYAVAGGIQRGDLEKIMENAGLEESNREIIRKIANEINYDDGRANGDTDREVSGPEMAGDGTNEKLSGNAPDRVYRRPAGRNKEDGRGRAEEPARARIDENGRTEEGAGEHEGSVDDHVLYKLGNQAEKPAPTADQLVKRVQDYGLRGILDEDAAKAFWTDAYAVMPEDARRQIVDQAFSSDSDRQELNIRRYTRQYIADLAKKGYAEDESGLLRYLADKLKDELGQNLDEDTLRYLIWRSANRYASNNILDLAEDISMRRRLHVGEFTGEKYPDEVNEAMNAASERIDEAETDREEARATTRRAARKTPYEALNRAMSAQRKYDQETVNSIVALAKEMIKKGNVDSVTAREMARLMTIIKDANGRRPATVKASANQLLDFLVDHTVSKEKELLDKIVKVRTAKVREPGVDTIAKLDLRAQNVINAFRENYKLSEAEIDNAISELEDKMADGRRTDASLEDMRSQLEGLQLAKQYAADISAKEADIKAIRQQMKDAQDEFAGLTAEEKKKFRTSLNEELATGEEMIRAKKIEEVEAYRRLRGDIAGAIDEGAERAKTFLEAERERVEQIHHWANSDMQGVPTDVRDRKLTGWAKVANWPAIRLVTAPLANLDQMLRTLGRKSPEGRGYLWNWMMGAVRKASDNEKLGLDAAEKKLNDKVREIFDDPKMEWNDLYSLERKMPKSKMRYFSANGEWVEEDMTQGNLLYIYMVNKMADGRMKLRQMNISEENVADIKKALDPRLVELADWIQEEFLPGLRDRYNETHKRLFGTSMASIENYFPLRILGGVVEEKRNVGDQEGKALPSDITGAIIKRTVNSKQLNLATDALSTVIEHVKEMELWNAYAEASRDFSTLLKYKRFQNQLKQLNTIYGAGQDLMNLFWDTVNLSVGAYRPTTTPADKAFLNIAKGVTAAKISFRAYTALKQMLSWPAFIADTNTFILAKNTLPSSWKKNWEWAMENLPNFKKRVESRKAGMDILEDTKLDSKFWGTDFAKWINQNGMFMNAFVDALTVSIGAKSVYDTRKARYLEEGFSEEEADKKAKFDAEVAYNETQQSSEKEFMSTMQANRTVLNVALSAYRNSSMGYQRQLHQALRTLGRMARKGYKQESIEYMTKQLTREGLSEADAEKAAKARYARAGYQAAIRVAVFGWLVQFAWNLGSHAAYLLFGDDPEEKKAMLKEDAGHALVGGGIEGLAAGNVMSDLLNMIRNKENLRNWDPTTLPIMSDIKSTISHMSSDPVAAWNDLVYLGAQIGLGTNPQTLSDAIVAIVDAANGDFETAREVMLCIMRILAVPQSQLDQIMIDEIGMKAKDARELTYEDVAKRYVDYKMMRNAPVTGEVLGRYEAERNDGLRAKREKSLKTTFKKKYNERQKLHADETKPE